jgi:pimeloyl-ACP methyl ester carboxylesterase
MRSRTKGAVALSIATAIWVSPVFGQAEQSGQSEQGPYPWAEQNRPPIVLHKHGIFWAGGQIVKRTQVGTETSGPDTVDIADQDYLVNQAYVEYFIPEHLRHGKKTPAIVMVPGGSLTGVHFLTKPNGREGWADFFIRRGFPVYIVDVPGRGRAGFNPDPFNNVQQGAAPPDSQPRISAFDGAAWQEWNSGPRPRVWGPENPDCIGNDARGTPPVYCNGNRMPARGLERYKHWLAANTPSVPTPLSSDSGVAAVLEKVGPAIYIGFSAGGSSGGRIANAFPQLFKAVIGIEPAQNCMLPSDIPVQGLTQVPTLSIHGINQVGRPNTGECVATYQAINAQGGDATYLSLPTLPDSVLARIGVSHSDIPQLGIWGNGHVMMWDDNSDQIAGVLYRWIQGHVEPNAQ